MNQRITVGSSQIAGILGIALWDSVTRMSVWARMMGLADDTQTAQTQRGHIIEPALLLWWEQKTGRTLTRCPAYEEGPSVIRDGWMHARWDGLIPGELVVEAKTTRSFDEDDGWGEDGSAKVPAGYQAQLAWQMAVLDVPEAELVAYCTLSDEVRHYRGIKRHMGVETALIAKIKAWMEAHVWCEQMSPPGPPDYDIVTALHLDGGQDDRQLVEPRQEEVDLARAYAEAHAAETAAKAEKERIKARLCERIGDAYGIKGIATWAHGATPDRIDADKLKTLYPEAYAASLVPGGPTRRFNLKWKDPNAAPKARKSKET